MCVVVVILRRFCCYFTFLAFSRRFEFYLSSTFLFSFFPCIFRICMHTNLSLQIRNSFIPISIRCTFFSLVVVLFVCFFVLTCLTNSFCLVNTGTHLSFHSFRYRLNACVCVFVFFIRAFHFSSCTFYIHV